jgi:hypothetical protein
MLASNGHVSLGTGVRFNRIFRAGVRAGFKWQAYRGRMRLAGRRVLEAISRSALLDEPAVAPRASPEFQARGYLTYGTALPDRPAVARRRASPDRQARGA